MSNNNKNYIEKGKDILRLFVATGSEAFIVGESLRDYLLDIEINYLEIYTNLSKDSIKELLKDYTVKENNDTLTALLLDYKFIIYPKRSFDVSSKTQANCTTKHYSTSLMAFLEKMDYKVNALALGLNDVIYDLFDGRTDLAKKRLKLINGNPQEIFSNSPIKILKTIALVSKLGFKLDKNIISGLYKKRKHLKKLSLYAIVHEMEEILNGKYLKKALKILVKSKVYKKIPYFRYEIKLMNKKFSKVDKDIFYASGLVKEKVYEEAIGNIMPNPELFHMLVNLAITNPKAEYDNITLYINGLDNCIKANLINYRLGNCKKKTKLITKLYNDLPIKKVCDLAFKGQDMLNIYSDINGSVIPRVIDEVIYKVLNKELENDYEKIKIFTKTIINDLKVDDINVSIQEPQEFKTQELKTQAFKTQEIKTKVFEEKEQKEVTSSDFENKIYKTVSVEDNNYSDLSKRIEELEITNLKLELDNEIEKKIRVMGFTDIKDSDSYLLLYKTCKDILIKDPKYAKLRGEKDGN